MIKNILILYYICKTYIFATPINRGFFSFKKVITIFTLDIFFIEMQIEGFCQKYKRNYIYIQILRNISTQY